MLSVVACVEDITFDVEIALSQQLGTQTLPFPGMDSEFILRKLNIVTGNRKLYSSTQQLVYWLS